jgi:hypothetical protein
MVIEVSREAMVHGATVRQGREGSQTRGWKAAQVKMARPGSTATEAAVEVARAADPCSAAQERHWAALLAVPAVLAAVAASPGRAAIQADPASGFCLTTPASV